MSDTMIFDEAMTMTKAYGFILPLYMRKMTYEKILEGLIEQLKAVPTDEQVSLGISLLDRIQEVSEKLEKINDEMLLNKI